MGDIISAFFSTPILFRALVVGILVSLCAALLGVSLVLKRYSMIGDGLSHVGFGALAIPAVMNCAPMVIAAAFLLLRISGSSKIKGDSAIALISTGALAIGVMAVSLSGMNSDLDSYLFGSIYAISDEDVVISVVLALLVLILFVFFYTRIFAITFDESFARATGTKAGLYNMLIALLTAITIVVGMRMMGSMLISSLIIFPALCSMRVFKSFKAVTVCSAVISVVTFIAGMVISYEFGTPGGASIVCVNILVFAGFTAVGAVMSRNRG